MDLAMAILVQKTKCSYVNIFLGPRVKNKHRERGILTNKRRSWDKTIELI